MLKWVLLALGLLLFVNGMFTRTYDYADPATYCFQMDIIDLVGCFGSPVIPQMVLWFTILAGGALVLGCSLWAWRHGTQKR